MEPRCRVWSGHSFEKPARRLEWIFRIGFSLLLLASLIYPALSIITKTNNFNLPMGGRWTISLGSNTRIRMKPRQLPG